MDGLKKFFRGEENFSFAFWIYGILGFFLIRFFALLLIKAIPGIFLDHFEVTFFVTRLLYVGAFVLQCIGVWRCSKKSDMLPRLLALIMFSILGAYVILIELRWPLFSLLRLLK